MLKNNYGILNHQVIKKLEEHFPTIKRENNLFASFLSKSKAEIKVFLKQRLIVLYSSRQIP